MRAVLKIDSIVNEFYIPTLNETKEYFGIALKVKELAEKKIII